MTRRFPPEPGGLPGTGGVEMMSSPVRVGAVSYLNAKPLYYSLCELCPGIELTMEVPSRWPGNWRPGSSTWR